MAQRNLLQFIILGLLDQTPMTGYELTKAFDSDIGEFWSAQHSQIYPQLQKLETAGLLTHTEEVTGEKLARKRYAITASGLTRLNDWLAAATVAASNGKDEFALKLYFIPNAHDPRLKPMLEAQQSAHLEKRAHLEHQLATKFPHGAPQSGLGHYLILQHAVSREHEYCDWLASALSQCQ